MDQMCTVARPGLAPIAGACPPSHLAHRRHPCCAAFPWYGLRTSSVACVTHLFCAAMTPQSYGFSLLCKEVGGRLFCGSFLGHKRRVGGLSSNLFCPSVMFTWRVRRRTISHLLRGAHGKDPHSSRPSIWMVWTGVWPCFLRGIWKFGSFMT